MDIVPLLGFIAFCFIVWAFITAELAFETLDGKRYSKPTISPVVPCIFLTLGMLFVAAAIFFGCNPHILQ